MRTVIITVPSWDEPPVFDVALNVPNDWDLDQEHRQYLKVKALYNQPFSDWLKERGAVEATNVEIFEDS
jgi:hypothetical protein